MTDLEVSARWKTCPQSVAVTNFDRNYVLHQKHLKLRGLQPKTIEAYARAIGRVGDYFDHQIDKLTEADLLNDFSDLSETHSWSSIKRDLYGLKFYHEHVLKKPWVAPGLVQPPRSQRLADIVTVDQAERIFRATRVLSYRVFFLAHYGFRVGARARNARRALERGQAIPYALLGKNTWEKEACQ